MRPHEAPRPLQNDRANIFLVRPNTRNIGNDLITHAVSELIYHVFGHETNIVNIPALRADRALAARSLLEPAVDS